MIISPIQPQRDRDNRRATGFTIVELLIVIVVIGILAAIALIAYNGIQNRAKVATMQSDLKQAAKKLESFKIASTASTLYPSDLTSADLKASAGTTYTYQVNNSTTPSDFCLSATNGTNNYYITSTITTPVTGTCSGIVLGGTACPTGFITVPGNPTFSTNDFCVMKYEAKITGQSNGNQAYSAAFVPESRADGTPWVNISQTNAITEAATVAGCTGCHLITENEWMTIAANVLSVASNWSGGAVGSGYIFSGHNDSTPNNSLAASTSDSDNYSGTGNTAGQTTLTNGVEGNAQERTLNLSNGEVIWDIAGNVQEWTNLTIAGNAQPGVSGAGYNYRQWNSGSLLMNGLPALSRPSAISGTVAGYSSVQGIGQVYSSYDETTLRAFSRGGSWFNNTSSGILGLGLSFGTGSPPTFTNAGFRVAR